MKTFKLYCILAFSFITIQINAQFSIGVRGGYIKAWMEYGEAEVPENAKIHVSRFQISALTYYKLSNRLGLGLEPGFTQRGAACFPGFAAFIGDTKLLMNYFELPLMITGKFPLFKHKFEVYGKAGYGVSIATSAYRRDSNIGTGQPPENTRLDLQKRALNNWDNGLYGGIGFAYKIKENQVFLESDYYYGLKDVDPLNTSKNRSIHLGLGYLVSL